MQGAEADFPPPSPPKRTIGQSDSCLGKQRRHRRARYGLADRGSAQAPEERTRRHWGAPTSHHSGTLVRCHALSGGRILPRDTHWHRAE